jgi:hypothetical protein
MEHSDVPPAKKRKAKGTSGNPPGILTHNRGDFQARLLKVKVQEWFAALL